MRTFARAAACLRTGASFFHFPSLRQRSLIDILKAKPFSLVFVEGLGEEKGSSVKVRGLMGPWRSGLTAENISGG